MYKYSQFINGKIIKIIRVKVITIERTKFENIRNISREGLRIYREGMQRYEISEIRITMG